LLKDLGDHILDQQLCSPGYEEPLEDKIPCFCITTAPFDDRVALLAPRKFCTALGPQGTYSFIWDSGASCCISSSLKDFVGPIKPWIRAGITNGITNGLSVHAKGTVAWTFLDSTGMFRTLKLPCLHVPKVPVHLLSMASLLQLYTDEMLHQTPNTLTLSGVDTAHPHRRPIQVSINPGSNLPVAQGFVLDKIPKGVAALNMTVQAVDEANCNLTESDKELLRWHQRLGHMAYARI
jgi:hypothetical protein